MSADAYSLFTDRVSPGVDLRFVSSLPLEGPLNDHDFNYHYL